MKKLSCIIYVVFTCGMTQALAQQSVPFDRIVGTITEFSDDSVTVNTRNGTLKIATDNPLAIYVRKPSDFSHITSKAFIGVTSTKQADGSEQATEIHIFPEELRGTGEGSFMMDSAGFQNTSKSRMTNGTVAPKPNKIVNKSRMTNGTVRSQAGSSELSVEYAGETRTISVPANTPVTVFEATTDKPKRGQPAAVFAQKQPDGSLKTSRIIALPDSK